MDALAEAVLACTSPGGPSGEAVPGRCPAASPHEAPVTVLACHGKPRHEGLTR